MDFLIIIGSAIAFLIVYITIGPKGARCPDGVCIASRRTRLTGYQPRQQVTKTEAEQEDIYLPINPVKQKQAKSPEWISVDNPPEWYPVDTPPVPTWIPDILPRNPVKPERIKHAEKQINQ